MPSFRLRSRAPRQTGAALALALHVVLLLVVLGQIVYLASRHRVRFDLTTDGLYSTTASTRGLLDKLDKRLVIEAYFSPKEGLPVNYRETRVVLDNFLDELVQLGRGKVVVQRFDPNSDKAVADRATRVGIKPAELRSATSSSLSFDRHWQGLRLVYGDKQKVVEQAVPTSSFIAEMVLTPAIKEVATSQKRRIGYMEWPAPGGAPQQASGIGWNLLRTVDQVAKRYEFQNFKDEDAPLLPDDLETLFLFRPKDLGDRQKYVIDQFVMHGGTLVVFADAVEYAIGPQRQFARMPFQIDAPGSNRKFVDQLLEYGIDWKPRVLADLALETYAPRDRLQQPQEYMSMLQQTALGASFAWVPYPYFFHAVAGDWSKAADQLARDPSGKIDNALADQYRKRFGPGLPADDFLWKPWKQLGRGPGLYWPTWVGLRERAGGVLDLPAGVTGRVLMQSSPALLAEEGPPNVDPLGHGDARARGQQAQKFVQQLNERFRAAQPQQAPLMVEVRGTFTSFFAAGERPKRPSEIKEEEARKAAAASKGEPPKDPATPVPPDEIGPPPAKDKVAEKPTLPAEPAPVAKSTKPARIVVIGDSDFIRDDFVRGDHRQAGGPYSMFGGAFFTQMLDWIAEDRDLADLQARVPVDRTMRFVDTDAMPGNDARIAEQAVRTATSWLRFLNVALPCGLLAAFGFVVWMVRRAQQRAFASLTN